MPKFISDSYSKDPQTIKFNDKYVEKNRHHTDAQYKATKTLVEEQGQTKPIYILDGLCVDGRHRTKIAVELEREVLCRDLDPNLSEKDITILCNEEVLSGRDYNFSQRAIWALRELVLGLDISMTKAAEMSKVDRRMISYASTIRGLGREDVLDALMKGERVQIGDMQRPSASLEVLCKNIKAEQEIETVEVDDSERIQYNPDARIKTESGKAWFYNKMKDLNISEYSVEIRMDYTELANHKFKESIDGQ